MLKCQNSSQWVYLEIWGNSVRLHRSTLSCPSAPLPCVIVRRTRLEGNVEHWQRAAGKRRFFTVFRLFSDFWPQSKTSLLWSCAQEILKCSPVLKFKFKLHFKLKLITWSKIKNAFFLPYAFSVIYFRFLCVCLHFYFNPHSSTRDSHLQSKR